MKRVITLATTKTSVVFKDFFANKCKLRGNCILKFWLGASLSCIFIPWRLVESLVYSFKIKKVKVQEPVFVVGHWRSGTTIMQYTLGQDKAFSYINPLTNYSVNGSIIGAILRKPLEEELRTGRDMDNMQWGITMPYEDYITFTLWSTYSSWIGNLYPQNARKYQDYAFVDEMPPKFQKKWKKSYDKMLRKFAVKFPEHYRYLLKSPDASARVKFLSELYPDAKFIATYRDPYATIRSMIHMQRISYNMFSLQKDPTDEELETFVIEQFKRIYHKYFDDLKSLPEDKIVEVKFEDLEKDTMGEVKKIYDKFGWDFESCKDDIQAYIDGVGDYKKNVYDYSPRFIKRINDELGFYFEHYGYEKLPVPEETITK